MAGWALAAVDAGVGYGGGGAGWTCSGLGVERTWGISRRDSIGPGSGGSPDLRKPCPEVAAAPPAAFAGAVVGAAGASPGAEAGAAAGADGEAAPPPGLAGAASVTSGTGGGGGGGAGAATAANPARNLSSLYFAFVRSAIRLCVSFSRSAEVSARLGGGGTVERFG